MFNGVVTCRACMHFLPGTPNPDQSLGMCGVLLAWLNKFEALGRNPLPAAEDENYRKLGNKLFWPNTDRYCQRFEKTKAALSGETDSRLSSTTGALCN